MAGRAAGCWAYGCGTYCSGSTSLVSCARISQSPGGRRTGRGGRSSSFRTYSGGPGSTGSRRSRRRRALGSTSTNPSSSTSTGTVGETCKERGTPYACFFSCSSSTGAKGDTGCRWERPRRSAARSRWRSRATAGSRGWPRTRSRDSNRRGTERDGGANAPRSSSATASSSGSAPSPRRSSGPARRDDSPSAGCLRSRCSTDRTWGSSGRAGSTTPPGSVRERRRCCARRAGAVSGAGPGRG